MRGKAFYIFFGAATLALMGTIGGIMLARISSAEDTIIRMQNELSMTRGELTDTVDWKLSEVREGLFEELNRQNANAFEVSYTITDYNGPERLAYVLVRFALKRYEPGAPVNVLIAEEITGGETKTVPAAPENGYFTARTELKLGPAEGPAVYNVSYQITTAEGAVAGEPLTKIIPYNSLYDRILSYGVELEPPAYDRAKKLETISMRLFLLNDFKGKEDLRFASCTLEILFDGRVLETLDLMEFITVAGGMQQLDNYEITRSYPDDALRRPQNQEGAHTMYEARLHAVDGYGFAYDFT